MKSYLKALILALIVFGLTFSQAIAQSATYDLDSFKADLDFLGTVSQGKLLFNPFGTNPDPNFVKHRLSDEQIQFLCDSDCQAKNIGVNFGTMYKGGDYQKARSLKMNWSLEIAQTSSVQAIADIINYEGVDNVIVRIGVAGNSLGFDSPNTYVDFLNDIAGRVGGKTFYAIAGPNEPDIERWAAPSCSPPSQSDPSTTRSQFYDCVGPELATYMNYVIAHKPGNVRLLSPAFNLTSFMFNDDTGRADGIPLAMARSGANFAGLDAIAGNIYPAGDSMQNIWNNHVQSVITQLGRPVVITETGPWNPLNDLFAGYDTSIYDDYNASDEEYYLHPIAGLSGSRSLTTIRNDLINQGYQAYCATPGFRIGYSDSGGQKLSEYINAVNEGYNEGRGIGFGAEHLYPQLGYRNLPYYSTLTVDYREVLAPVFRDVSGKRFLTTSLEEFMGFKDTVLQENPAAELSSAAVNSLLSNQQRCEQSINILLAQETMCNKLQVSDACPLYPRAISGTSYTIKSLIDAYKGFVSSPPDDLTLDPQIYNDKETAGQVCAYLLTQNSDSELKTGLLHTPLTIDRAYRLGFLVTSIENKFTPQSSGSMFNLFAHPNAGFRNGGATSPKHTVLVNAFKIPDILTNNNSLTDNGQSSARTSWNDPSLITTNMLQTRDQQSDSQETKTEFWSTLADEANSYDTSSQGASDEVFCVLGTGRGVVGAESCKDELSKAVIDIINATASLSQQGNEDFEYFQPTCPDLEKEPASSIQDDGAFGSIETIYSNPTNGTLFSTQFGGELLKRIFDIPNENVAVAVDLDETHQLEPRGKSHPAFAQTWRDGDPEIVNPWPSPVRNWGLKTIFYVIPAMESLGWPYAGCCDEVEVRHYLVYPVGYDMNTVQTFLAGSFFSSEQLIDLAESAQDYDRIELTGDQVDFEGATMTEEFENWLHKCWHTDCDEDGTHCKKVYREPCDDSISFSVEQVGENYPVGLLGAKFGYYLRAIQKGLSNKVGTAMDYLDSCQSTEQFLTGRCGESLDPVAKPGPAECTDLSCGREPTSAPTPVASGSCLDIRVVNGQVEATNKCACAFGDWHIQDASGSLWCGPLGGGNTLFPYETKGGFCSDKTPPNPVCATIWAPGGSPGNCLTENETVCVSW